MRQEKGRNGPRRLRITEQDRRSGGPPVLPCGGRGAGVYGCVVRGRQILPTPAPAVTVAFTED
ncbi:hypothetical protein NGM37_23945, partial [Streptomyces sp. TRM76130]|nr:hypothetical protein [Streptomyces sp. TRM76130]